MQVVFRFVRSWLALAFLISSWSVLGARADALPPPELDNVVYGAAPLSVQFNASRLGLGGELTYLWEFGDGNSSTDPAPLHTYAAGGQYTARLTTISDTGSQAQRAVIVYVDGAAQPQYPAADVNKDCTVNIIDLITVRNNLNLSAENNPSDVNRDGKINIIDLIYVRNRLGEECSE